MKKANNAILGETSQRSMSSEAKKIRKKTLDGLSQFIFIGETSGQAVAFFPVPWKSTRNVAAQDQDYEVNIYVLDKIADKQKVTTFVHLSPQNFEV